jgi:hypothetical protein
MSIGDKIRQARQAGHPDDKIIEYLRREQDFGPKIEQALSAGHTSAGVLDYLSKPKQSDGYLTNALRTAVGQGAGFGFGDEIEAGVRAPFSERPYREIRDDIRENLAGFAQDNPGTATTLEIGGGFLTPGGALLGMGKAGRAAMAGETVMGTVGRGAAIGAGAGAISGAGSAGEMSDIPASAVTGAAVGAPLGAATPVAVNASGGVFRRIRDGFGLGGPKTAENFADRKLIEALRRDGYTPEQAAQRLQEARDLGVSDMLVADLGSNSTKLGFSATTIPNSVRRNVETTLSGRSQDEAANIAALVHRRSGLADNQMLGIDYIDDLARRQSDAARTAYPDAYRIHVPAQPFRQFTDRAVVNRAYEEARKLADVDGIKLPEFSQIRNAQAIPTEIMHQLKRGLGQIIAKETDALGKTTPFGAAVTKLSQEINDTLKALNPQYAKANAEFADFSRLKRAYDDGNSYLKLTEGDMVKKLKAMTPAEKEAFRVAVVSQVQNRASTLDDSVDFTRAVFGSPKKKSALRYAFDNENEYQAFSKAIDDFQSMRRTNQKVLGGSPTAERLTAQADAASDPTQILNITQNLARGNYGRAAGLAAQNLGARAGGMSEMSAEILSKRLFTASPQEQKQILSELGRRAADDQRRRSQSIMRNPALYSAGAGVQGGLLNVEPSQVVPGYSIYNGR